MDRRTSIATSRSRRFLLVAILAIGIIAGCSSGDGADATRPPTDPTIDTIAPAPTTTTTAPDLAWIDDVLAGLDSASTGSVGAGPTDGAGRCIAPTATPVATGFDSLFIGHSFFVPVAERLGRLAPAVGLSGHSQTTVFSGGASGAPQALWDDPSDRERIQSVLDTGRIELFGMTYHPDHPGIEGYLLWADYALARNPRTIIFIAMPWLTDPTTMDAQTYVSTWDGAHRTITHSIVDRLRTHYGCPNFFDIPYGAAAGALYSSFESGTLAGISNLVRTSGSAAGDAIFGDAFGHGDSILIDTSALIWLRAIYGIRADAVNVRSPHTADIRSIADSIMDRHDGRYDAPHL